MFSGENLGRRSILAVSGLLLSVVAGCGAVDPWDEIPVSGKITYEDGSVIKTSRLLIYFESQTKQIAKNISPRPGAADVNLADGTFAETTTLMPGDGLIPGRHTVLAYRYDTKRRREVETLLEIVKITSFDAKGNPTELTVPPPEIEVSPKAVRFEIFVKK